MEAIDFAEDDDSCDCSELPCSNASRPSRQQPLNELTEKNQTGMVLLLLLIDLRRPQKRLLFAISSFSPANKVYHREEEKERNHPQRSRNVDGSPSLVDTANLC